MSPYGPSRLFWYVWGLGWRWCCEVLEINVLLGRQSFSTIGWWRRPGLRFISWMRSWMLCFARWYCDWYFRFVVLFFFHTGESCVYAGLFRLTCLDSSGIVDMAPQGFCSIDFYFLQWMCASNLSGASVLFFPEGTRSESGQMDGFKVSEPSCLASLHSW